jgi:hypothetical protein
VVPNVRFHSPQKRTGISELFASVSMRAGKLADANVVRGIVLAQGCNDIGTLPQGILLRLSR